MKKTSPDDIFVWPDGSWCYRCEYTLPDYGWKSDDFRVIPVDSEEYDAFCTNVEKGLSL